MNKRALTLGTYNTAQTGLWTLAGLELSSPTFQTNLVQIPGRDGPLDLSAALTGGVPRYNSRTLKATLENSDGTRQEREARIREMIAELDGFRKPIWLPDDPDHYLEGRIHVARDYNDLAHAAVTVTVTCDPWLYNNQETVRTLTATSQAQTELFVNYGRRTVVPVLDVTGSVHLEYMANTWTLSEGTYQLPDFALDPGSHQLTYSGNGAVTITYREAVLL